MSAQARPQLTPTQWRVLARVAAGESNSTIATALGVAPKTVKNHLTRIAQQLPRDAALTKRAAAAAWYLTVGRALHEREASGDG